MAFLAAACSGENSSSLGQAKDALHASGTPYWSGGTGAAVHHAPVPWPTEPSPSSCGATCGQWRPYTRFGQNLADPRIQDPSNGGTSPQSYVNVSSSCTDKALPSTYYYLHRHPTDATKDVILFRWRVTDGAHTYGTGSAPGTFRSGSPWSSALWTVLFSVDGTGYRDLAAHINGSSGSPSAPVDTLAGIYGKIPTQSIDYLEDPINIKLLGTQPTAFVDDGTDQVLNFQNSLTPTASWPNGAAETVWDYGTTRARLVTDRPCTEYFIDYQIPVAMLDASAHGGPKVDRSTPISMLFCTANSLNNPFQKDCALGRTWGATASQPAPFGDFISFDQTEPYAQPIIREVIARAPSTCGQTYELAAKVQDAFWVTATGTVQSSIKAVSFWYYHDVDGDRVADDGSTWTFAANANAVSGKLNEWQASWDSRGLPRGSYLIGVQAVDDNTRIDDGMVASGVDNRTFSYVTSDALGQMYIGGTWQIDSSHFPTHAPAVSPSSSENWYGNPLVTGIQVAGTGVDLALNACGIAPTLTLTGTPGDLTAGETVAFTATVSNAGNTSAVTVSTVEVELPAGFTYVNASSGGPLGSGAPSVAGQTLTWTLAPAVSVAAEGSSTLTFSATASSVPGHYNAQGSATTSFGAIASDAVPFTVYSARASLSQTASRSLVAPDGSTPVTFTLNYANNSPVTLSNASITNVLPANVNHAGCTGGLTCSLAGGTVTWQLGMLAPGASGSVTLTVNFAPAYSGSSYSNVALLEATAPDGTLIQSPSTSVIALDQPIPAFSLTMTSSASRIDPGMSATWTMAYRNDGTGAANGSLLVDTLPAGFTFASCTVTGSTHFTGCTNASGTVTFHGAGGAGVALPAGASGTVTLTATAAAAPFTYPNPGTNQAVIHASGGQGSAQAQAAVGITGQYCDYTFYFRRGTDNILSTVRPATTAAPTGTSAYSTTVANVTSTSFSGTSTHPDQIVFLQETPFAEATDLSGLQTTINFFLGAVQGGVSSRVILENADTSATIATSSSISVTNGQNWYSYSVAVPGGTIVNAGHRLRWVFQFIKPGGTRDITFYYDSASQQSRSSFCAATSPAKLTLSANVDKPLITSGGEKLTYTLRYANVGGTSATSVSLTNVVPSGASGCEYSSDGSSWLACSSAGSSPPSHAFALGTLAAGATGVVYVRADAPPSPTPGQTLTNTATIQSTETSSVTATASTTANGTSGGTPAITVTASADKGFVGPSEVVTYTFEVINAGTGPATNVAVSSAVPATAWYSYVGGSISGGDSRSVSGSNLSWMISNLAVGSAATLTFQMASSATGMPSGVTPLDVFADVVDDTYCTGGSKPAGCTSNTVTVSVDGSAALTLSNTASVPTGSPGDLITYTLTVASVGSSAATDVIVHDTLPAHVRLDAITAGSGTFDAVNNRVVFSLGDLAAGQTSTLGLRVRINSSLPAGQNTLDNVAMASGSNAQVRTATASTVVEAEPVVTLVSTGPTSLADPAARLAVAASNSTALTMDATAMLEVGGYLLVNGTVTRVAGLSGNVVTVATPVTASAGAAVYRSAAYAVSYTNSGDAAADSVVVTSTLPSGWSYVTATPSANVAPSVGGSGNVSWTLGNVLAGFSSSLQVVAIPTVTGALESALTDTRACTGGPTPGCSDSVETIVGGLTARKRTSTSVVSAWPAGGVAQYTVTLSNSLNVPVANVAVTDLLPDGFTYRSGSGTPTPTGVTGGQPTWSSLTVPAGDSLEIVFEADVSATTGTGTYDNHLTVSAPAGVGVTAFDALGTRDEDVTVLGSGVFVASGFVFRDQPTLGALDADDTGIQDVSITLDDGSGTPYVVQTDGFGYFHRVLPAGTWSIAAPNTGANITLLDDLSLQSSYTMPASVSSTGGSSATVQFGYVDAVESTHVVSTAVVGGGLISPTSSSVTDGQTASFTVTPNTGYSVTSVTGCGGSLTGNTYTTAAVTADCTVTATFTLNQYTVTPSPGSGGALSPSGPQTVNHGGATSFTVTADPGHSVSSVTGCGGSLSGSTYTTGAVTGSCTVTATFSLNSYTVTPSAGTGGTLSPGGPQTVNHGQSTAFVVAADAGYTVTSVTGCGGSLTGSTFTTAAVTGDCTVTATFTLNQYTVTPSAGPGGSLTPGSAQTVAHGQTTSFTVTPATGYSVSSVTGCGGTLAGGTYTTAAVTASCTVSATFSLDQYTVTPSAGTGGSLSPGGAQTVNHGQTTSFIVTPDAGYSVASVTGCSGSLVGGTYTTGSVTGNCTVTASFTLNQHTVTPSAGPGGTLTPGGAQSVDHGATTSFTVTPDAGYTVASVTGCGGALMGSTYTTAAVSAPCTITATFSQDPYTITALAGPNGSLTCDATAEHGASVSCTLSPAAGFVLATLTDNGVDVMAQVSSGTYAIASVTQNHTIGATFLAAAGTSCALSAECATQHCVDGVCCASACNGQCEACDEPGSEGSCTPVTGAPRGARAACATDGSLCGGTCDGVNGASCLYPTSSCREASCADSTATLAASCDGMGACPPAQTQSCLPSSCGETACVESCSTDTECNMGEYCAAGTCVPRKEPGQACDSTNQCATGFCTDGVCCNSNCEGQCEACDVSGSVGVCAPVQGAPRGARAACDSDGSACGGFCNGIEVASCSYPGAETQCRAQVCASSTTTLAASCNGEGSCPTSAQAGCEYGCAEGACAAQCVVDADCPETQFCLVNVCREKGKPEEFTLRGSGEVGCSSAGRDGWAPMALLLAGMALVRRRRASSRLAGLVLALLAFTPARVDAQVVNRRLTLDRYQPRAGAYDVLSSQSAHVGGHLEFSTLLSLDYADAPLRLLSVERPDYVVKLVSRQTTLNIGATLGLFDRLELAVSLPVTLGQSSNVAVALPPTLSEPVERSGAGDLRITPKAHLWARGKWAFATAATLSLPTGGGAYMGQGTVTLAPMAIAEWGQTHSVRFMANAGVILRGGRRIIDLDVGNALVYGLAGEIPLLLSSQRVALVTSLQGEEGFAGAPARPLELLAGARWLGKQGMTFTVGGGPGLTEGYGSPTYRVLAELGYTPARRQRREERQPERPAAPLTPPPPPAIVVAEVVPPAPPEVESSPELLTPLPALEGAKLILPEPVHFATNKDIILKMSYPVLEHAASLIRSVPEWRLIRIEGHTDNEGSRAYNKDLSARRARSVRSFLIQAGIEPERLEAVGFGPDQPVDTNDTVAGRARNRRVEFIVVDPGM